MDCDDRCRDTKWDDCRWDRRRCETSGSCDLEWTNCHDRGGSRRGRGEVIDATGLVVAPGFIDVHSHSDLCYLVDPSAKSKIMQGVTTRSSGIAGGISDSLPIRESTQRDRVVAALRCHPDYVGLLPGEYVSSLSQQGASVNIGFLVGHETVRSAVMGLERRAPRASELSEMKEMVREGLAAGALGCPRGCSMRRAHTVTERNSFPSSNHFKQLEASTSRICETSEQDETAWKAHSAKLSRSAGVAGFLSMFPI